MKRTPEAQESHEEELKEFQGKRPFSDERLLLKKRAFSRWDSIPAGSRFWCSRFRLRRGGRGGGPTITLSPSEDSSAADKMASAPRVVSRCLSLDCRTGRRVGRVVNDMPYRFFCFFALVTEGGGKTGFYML